MNPFTFKDIVTDSQGNRYKVLAVVGDLVWLSLGDDFDRAGIEANHWKELNDYKIEETV